MTNPIMRELSALPTPDPRERTDIRNPRDTRDEEQKERVPLGGMRMQLTMDEIPGYHTHVINDVADRIQRALAGGYVFRPKDGTRMGTGPELGHTDIGSAVSVVVGTNDDGSARRGYAMMIKQEWYDADQRTKGAELRKTEADINRGLNAQDEDNSNRYIPEEGIHIE